MSTLSKKAAAKRKPTNARTTTPKLAGHGGGPKGPIGHWTQWIISRHRPALLSERGVRCYFVVKNHGPDKVRLVAQYGDDYELDAGAVRATFAYGIIRVELMGEKSALIEFDFLPLNSRN